MARGLEKAHAAGVIHRDLKPANVFLTTRDNGSLLVKLLDFGVSKLLNDVGGARITGSGAPIGTPLYMSPEQAEGKDDTDGRADIWSLGAVLYEALAGAPPFADRGSYHGTIVGILTSRPKLLHDAAPWVPTELAKVVDAMLVHDRDARIKTAEAVTKRLLEAYPDGASRRHRPAHRGHRPDGPCRRRDGRHGDLHLAGLPERAAWEPAERSDPGRRRLEAHGPERRVFARASRATRHARPPPRQSRWDATRARRHRLIRRRSHRVCRRANAGPKTDPLPWSAARRRRRAESRCRARRQSSSRWRSARGRPTPARRGARGSRRAPALADARNGLRGDRRRRAGRLLRRSTRPVIAPRNRHPHRDDPDDREHGEWRPLRPTRRRPRRARRRGQRDRAERDPSASPSSQRRAAQLLTPNPASKGHRRPRRPAAARSTAQRSRSPSSRAASHGKPVRSRGTGLRH